MTNPWDKYEPPTPGGDFPEHRRTWDNVGDSIVGLVSNVRFTNFGKPDEAPSPELWVTDSDGVEWQVGCGPNDLKIKLAEKQPIIGDKIAIAFVETKRFPKGTGKLFRVEVERAGGPPVESSDSPESPSADSAVEAKAFDPNKSLFDQI
jgi:hypothetical protein